MNNLTIIDTTSLIWTACVTLGEGFQDDYIKCRTNFNKWFEDILISTDADCYIAFGDGGNFRKSLLQDHKNNRPVDRPKFIKPLTQDAVKQWELNLHNELESDDLCLLNNTFYKDKYNVTIASPDGDLRQYATKFYNYKKNRKEDNPEFSTIAYEEGKRRLWTTILKGGHNGLGGLKGCGEKTVVEYLSTFTVRQLPFAVLSAYIHGIDKKIYSNIRSSVKGYGEYKGIIEFNKNFISERLLTTSDEVDYILPDLTNKTIYEPIKYEKENIDEIEKW